MLLQHIIDIIERAAPLKWQEAWDNSGLQVGDVTAEITAALLTTDVTESVVAEAVSGGCQLIISHHPLIFHGLKHLTGSSPVERCVQMAIEKKIAIYSGHTSMDSWIEGVSGRMAKDLGVEDVRILVKKAESECAEANAGLGVIGELERDYSQDELLAKIKQVFGATYVRYTKWSKPIRKIAMCGGSGAKFIDEAIAQGADAYLTADCKYHEFQAAENRIALIDIDHWVSEHRVRDIYKELLDGHVECKISQADSTPICVY